jgi:hypothetical protein
MPEVAQKEYLTHEPGNEGAWECVCGNKPDSDGFFPCDSDGDEVEPVKGQWEDLYVCARCGRIIQQGTLKVVGRNTRWKRLE